MANILGINLRGLNEFCSAGNFDINSNKLEYLVAYIEKQKKVADKHHQQRYAIMWYDFLCSCSTPSGRAHLDIATLMVQLEGMFYYLLNGEYDKDATYYSYKDVYNKIAKWKITYDFAIPPLDVKDNSDLHYIIKVLNIFNIINRETKSKDKGKIFFSPDDFYLLLPDTDGKNKNYDNIDLRYKIKEFIKLQYGYWKWNNVNDKNLNNSKTGYVAQFATLINIIWAYIIEQKNQNLNDLNIDDIKNNLNNLRNNTSHGGSNSATKENQYDDIIKFILLIATELNEYTDTRENRNGRHILETITTTLTSVELLETINKTIDKICEIIDNMGKKKWLLAVMIITMGILGYFIYKDSSTTINYSNVPAVKRIELYDKAMSNELSEEYVKRMQSDIKRFEAIKQEVEQ